LRRDNASPRQKIEHLNVAYSDFRKLYGNPMLDALAHFKKLRFKRVTGVGSLAWLLQRRRNSDLLPSTRRSANEAATHRTATAGAEMKAMNEPSTTTPAPPLPPAVNFHLEKACNLRCKFCYAHFDDDDALRTVKRGLDREQAMRVIELVRESGAEKITFVGGEPTLCPFLPDLLRHARALEYTTTLVTNGFRLDRLLDEVADCLDWVGLSVDSADEATQAALGRDRGTHVAKSLAHFRRLHALGIRVKLNTVVTALNWQENMCDFVLDARPERWKLFQVLPVDGQNDGRVEPLLIARDQFDAFVSRHLRLKDQGIDVVPESNDAMTGSYAMIDPLGRFFSNVGGRHTYSPAILDVGVKAAFSAVRFDPLKFEARGGRYDWSTQFVPLTFHGKDRGAAS
jgi:radical S-adenosyl methionine domain-containing protein 2